MKQWKIVDLITLRRFNNILGALLICLALYIIVWPFLPGLNWWVRHDIPLVSSITAPKVNVKQIPAENTLIVPALGMREKIFEGESVFTVNQGVWRRPQTSTPDQSSNTVLVGHRFTYTGQSVFYNLDKVRNDDEIIIYWSGKAYTYKVDKISTVPPEAVEVEAPTDESILTLYTCAPLLTAKDRLVVTARLIQ